MLKQNDRLFGILLKKEGKAIEKEATELTKLLSVSSAGILIDVKKGSEFLGKMKATADIDTQLENYEKFLVPLIQVVKKVNVDPKFQIFYCPMVKKYWIQDTQVNKEVRNVFATYMLECGEQTSKF